MLLHGLGRGSASMEPLARRLETAGFRVANLRYPSTRLGPDELVSHLHTELAACCADTTQLHFVTHSLGGILVRAYVERHPLERLGRVVMLSPPNQGSELVDELGGSATFRWALGPTALELGTDPNSLPNRLPAVGFPLGVIAATRTINPLGSAIIPGDDDGVVAVKRMRVAGMSDFIALPLSHTFVMRSREVAAQTIHFLRTGSFLRDPAEDD